jgi:3-oxoacyl-[acyl-carrier-protein] synthase II
MSPADRGRRSGAGAERRRVVVTGIGTVNPLGLDVDAFWKAAMEGHSGVGKITSFDASELDTQIAAEVKGFDPEAHFERRELKRIDRTNQLFLVACDQAMADAGIGSFIDDPDTGERVAVVSGVGFGGMTSFIDEIDMLRTRGPHRISPYGTPKTIPNMGAGLAAIRFGILGPSNCTVTACAASANAIGEATEVIRRGAADLALAGGSEACVCDFGIATFNQARALSTRNDDPEAASRPFEANRDGFVMGEGAGALVLEERERAIARGARIHAEIIGFGMSTDAYHVTLPRPGGSGAALAMKQAMRDGSVGPGDIDYINAHGTATEANDVTETAAIKLALGEEAEATPVSSTKSMTGHLLGGAGAVEAIACILAIRDGMLPPTINYEDPDPACDLDYVPNTARPADVDIAMSNSFGFGGHNVALVLARHEG